MPMHGYQQRIELPPVAVNRRRLSGSSPTQSKLADYYLVARHARDNQEDIVAVDGPKRFPIGIARSNQVYLSSASTLSLKYPEFLL